MVDEMRKSIYQRKGKLRRKKGKTKQRLWERDLNNFCEAWKLKNSMNALHLPKSVDKKDHMRKQLDREKVDGQCEAFSKKHSADEQMDKWVPVGMDAGDDADFAGCVASIKPLMHNDL